MLFIQEDKNTQNKIIVELTAFFNRYKKPGCEQQDTNKLLIHMSAILDLWEYAPQEIRLLDRKAFMDLTKECYKKSTDKGLFSRVFDL